MVQELLLLCEDRVCTVSTTESAFCLSLPAFVATAPAPASATLKKKKKYNASGIKKGSLTDYITGRRWTRETFLRGVRSVQKRALVFCSRDMQSAARLKYNT